MITSPVPIRHFFSMTVKHLAKLKSEFAHGTSKEEHRLKLPQVRNHLPYDGFQRWLQPGRKRRSDAHWLRLPVPGFSPLVESLILEKFIQLFLASSSLCCKIPNRDSMVKDQTYEKQFIFSCQWLFQHLILYLNCDIWLLIFKVVLELKESKEFLEVTN